MILVTWPESGVVVVAGSVIHPWLESLFPFAADRRMQQGTRPVKYPQNRTQGLIMLEEKKDAAKAPALLDVLGSVLAGMFGVQSNRKRTEDFTHGKPSQYIVIGLIVTILFVLTIWGVVNLVMKLAGA